MLRKNPSADKQTITLFFTLSLQAGTQANLLQWCYLLGQQNSPLRLLMSGSDAVKRHLPKSDPAQLALISEWMRMPKNMVYAGMVFAATENLLHEMERAPWPPPVTQCAGAV